MKYKKHIVTGALALSLLVSGSSVFAATPQDLGIKNSQPTYQRQNKNNKFFVNVKKRGKGNTVGIISAINGIDFILDVRNLKTKVTTSEDVKTNSSTTYRKNGVKVLATDLAVGQKVIVIGKLDKKTNTLTAKTVKIVVKKGAN